MKKTVKYFINKLNHQFTNYPHYNGLSHLLQLSGYEYFVNISIDLIFSINKTHAGDFRVKFNIFFKD